MGKDIFHLKPSVYGFGIDLRELYRRLMQRADVSGDLAVQVKRFIEVFRAHGLHLAHIPRLTSLRYIDLKDEDTLLSAMTPSLIDTTAALFGVRSEWLAGIDDDIYQGNYCYKSPSRLFECIDSLKERATSVLRAVTSAGVLDMNARRSQRLELVVVEHVQYVGEFEVLRYHPFADGWDWSELGCRVQLKAMLRTVGRAVPLHQTSHAQIDAWYRHQCFPGPLVRGPLITAPSLEDYSLSPAESRVSKESSELQLVEQYIAEKLTWAEASAPRG